jgi:predicted alpha/beta superfamily hydrolase
MDTTRTSNLLTAALACALSGFGQTPACTATGNLEIVDFKSTVFANARKLRILLPSGYRESSKRYSVLYLNDGQNLFDVCTSIFQPEEWRVDETVGQLIGAHEIVPIIVVGIDNAGKRLRPKEYLPWIDDSLQPPEPNPQGKQYPRFLLDEVVPFVESRYRTDPRNRVLGGSSYGAGIALYTVIARPGSFRGLLMESPSIYADDYHLLKEAERVNLWPRQIYLGTGTVGEPVEDVQRLAEFFNKKGVIGNRLHVVVQQGGAHTEKWWAERLPGALKFLFAPAH